MKKSKEPKCRLRQSAAGDTCTGVRPSDVSLSSLPNVIECIGIMFIKVNLQKPQHTILSHHPHHHPIHKDRITNPRMGKLYRVICLSPVDALGEVVRFVVGTMEERPKMSFLLPRLSTTSSNFRRTGEKFGCIYHLVWLDVCTYRQSTRISTWHFWLLWWESLMLHQV